MKLENHCIRKRALRHSMGALACASVLIGAVALNVAAASAKASHLTTVTWVRGAQTPPDVASSQAAAMEMLGYPAKNGLKLNIITAQSSTLGFAALISGQAQFLETNPIEMMTNDLQGAGIVEACGLYTASPASIVAGNGITSASQVNGRTFGFSSLGSTPEWTTDAFFNVSGLADPSTFKLVAAGSQSTTFQDLIAGKIDFTWVPSVSLASVLAQNPNLHVIVSAKQLEQTVPAYGGAILVLRSYYNSHKTIVNAFCKSAIEANRALYKSEAVYAKIVNHSNPGVYTPQQIQSLYGYYHPIYAVNGGINTKQLNENFTIWSAYVDPSHALNGHFRTLEQLTLTGPTEAALSSLGVFPKVDQPTALGTKVLRKLSVGTKY